jgi:YfiH family protein
MTRVTSHDLGIQWIYDRYLVHFGNRKGTAEAQSKQFESLQIYSIKQVHGDSIVEGSSQLQEADAHYTSLSATGLLIKTADCMPIFIVDPVQKNVAAIHAGWRGVASQITLKTIWLLHRLGGNPRNFRVVIGPHIRQQSFEVDEPVWVQLMDSVPVQFNHQLRCFYESLPQNKFKVNLEGIVRTQVQDLNVPDDQIESIDIDTFTNSEWHSFRRDREQSGRNLSFIVKN